MANSTQDQKNRPPTTLTWEDLRHGPPARPLWPDIGRALNLGRSATYAAAARGDIPTVRIGGRVLGMVPALLRMLGDDGTDR